MKKVFFTAAIAAAVCMSSVAQAAIYFSKDDLLSMKSVDALNFGYTESARTGDGLTDDPHFNYPGPPFARTMTGLAGAVGGLESGDPNLPQAFSDLGYAATSFYALGDTELAALNAKISAGETINSAAWNDNDDSWVVGIWAVDQTWPFGGAGSGSLDGLFLAAGTGGGVSLDLASFGVPPDTIAAAGVFVALREGAADDTYHASWGVPEPTSILVWSALAMVTLASARRSRDDR